MKTPEIKNVLFYWLVIVLITAGCATMPRVYISPELKEQNLKRIGVLGFKGPNSDYITDIFTVELLKRLGGDYEIVGKNLLIAALKREDIGKGDIQELGKSLSLDGIIVGSIGEYGYLREGDGVHLGWVWEDADEKTIVVTRDGLSEFPAAALSIQLLDAQKGKILFSASYARRVGRSYSVGRLVEEMVEQLAASFKDALEEAK